MSGFSEYIGDGGTNWEALGVRPGDQISLDGLLDGARTVVAVEQISPGQRLRVTPAVPFPSGGANYTISRPIQALLVEQDLSLYVADGPNAIGKISTNTWFWYDSLITPQPLFGSPFGLAWSGDLSITAATSFRANDLARRGDVTYLATDIGVHSIADGDLDASRIAKFVYSTPAVTEFDAEFKILEGTEANVAAIAVDPETGNISVAVTELESVVTEINPNIEQAFRFFDNVGRIRSLVTYRNPSGPPDVEVT